MFCKQGKIFDHRKCVGCPKFEKKQTEVLNHSASAWDATSDMWDFTEDCFNVINVANRLGVCPHSVKGECELCPESNKCAGKEADMAECAYMGE